MWVDTLMRLRQQGFFDFVFSNQRLTSLVTNVSPRWGSSKKSTDQFDDMKSVDVAYTCKPRLLTLSHLCSAAHI